MGFGEILYFLIGAGWLFYSWKKKKHERENSLKKNDYNTETAKEEETSSSFLEEIISMQSEGVDNAIEKIFEKPKHELKKEKPPTNIPYFKDPEPTPTASKPIDNIDPDYFEKIRMGGTVKRSTKKKERKKPILTEPQEAPDFDIREAVINSEILNRKY